MIVTWLYDTLLTQRKHDNKIIKIGNIEYIYYTVHSDNCGVVHMHRNQKVIGPSRAEDYMTKCAIQDVYHNNQYSQAPAMECEPYSAVSIPM